MSCTYPEDVHWICPCTSTESSTGGGSGGGSGGAYDGISITGSSFTGGTISQSAASQLSISASAFVGGTINGSTLSSVAITGSTLTGATLTTCTLSAPTVTSGQWTSGLFLQATLTGPTITAPSVTGGTFTGSTITGATIGSSSFPNATLNNPTIVGGSITGLPEPTVPSQAATKGYVDSLAAGLLIKEEVVVATVGSNITLAGSAPDELDDIPLSLNDRILVKDQTAPAENGIYEVTTVGTGANGTWARTADADTGVELLNGAYVHVVSGTENAGSSWVQSTTGTITLGSTPLVWVLYSSAPVALSSAIEIRYSSVVTSPGDPTTSPGNWTSYSNSSTYWMAVRSMSLGVWGSWVVTQIRGLDGTNGTNGAPGAPGNAGIPGLDGSTTFYATSSNPPSANRAGDLWFVTDMAFGMMRATAPGTTFWQPAFAGIDSAFYFDPLTQTYFIKKAAIQEVRAGAIITGDLTAALTITGLGKIVAGTGLSTITLDTSGMTVGDPTGIYTRISGSTNQQTLTLATNSAYPMVFTAGSGGANLRVGPFNLSGRVEIGFNATNQIIVADYGIVGRNSSGRFAVEALSGNSVALTAGGAERLFVGADGHIKINGGDIRKASADGWGPKMFDGDNTIEFKWDSNALHLRVDGVDLGAIWP